MKIGLITVGHSPREDVTPALQAVLGSSAQLIEKGALDCLERAEIEKLAPKVQACIKELEAMGVDLNVLLCTGEFPRLKAKKPLIMLETLITGFTSCVKSGKIGVIVSEKEQVANAEKKWKRKGVFYGCGVGEPLRRHQSLK